MFFPFLSSWLVDGEILIAFRGIYERIILAFLLAEENTAEENVV